MLLQNNPEKFWLPFKQHFGIDDDFIVLMSSMMAYEPSGRPTMADMIGSNWMRGEVATSEQFIVRFEQFILI